MEGEASNFFLVWVSAFLSLSYCHAVSNFVPRGPPRLLALAPVLSLFLLLPLRLRSLHLAGATAFFLAWLANFKLLLFAFGRGPLAADPSVSLLRFAALSSLPINTRDSHNPTEFQSRSSPMFYAAKGAALAAAIVGVRFGEVIIHPVLSSLLLLLQLYLSFELILAAMTIVPRFLLGLDLAPQFGEPYLSTSLQDFWGRRWNLMTSSVLRAAVYLPARRAASRIFGRRGPPILAVMATFAVSALMHELVFYYMSRTPPTWHVTRFFLLHGLCLSVEIVLKKTLAGSLTVPAFISCPLTLAFMASTAFWLFFPELLRLGFEARAIEEYATFVAFVKDLGMALTVNMISG